MTLSDIIKRPRHRVEVGVVPRTTVSVPGLGFLPYPAGLDRVIQLVSASLPKNLADISRLFNLLVPNSRHLSQPKISDLNAALKYNRFINAKSAPHTMTVFSTNGSAALAQETVLYAKNATEGYLLEDLIKRDYESLLASGAVASDVDLEKIGKIIKDIIEKYVLTAQGMPCKVHVVHDDATLSKLVSKITEKAYPIIIDIETSGLDPYTSDILGIGLCVDASEGFYIPCKQPIGGQLDYQASFSSEGIKSTEDITYAKILPKSKIHEFVHEILVKRKIVAHNAKFEYQFFKTNFSVSLDLLLDTMIGEYILDCRLSGRFNLGSSVADRFPMIEEWKEGKSFFKALPSVPINKIANYCVKDCCNEALLMMAQMWPLYKDFKYLLKDVDMPFLKVLAEAELTGFGLDREYLTELNLRLRKQVDEMGVELSAALNGINVDSAAQLCNELYTVKNYTPEKKTGSGSPSVDVEALEKLAEKTGDPILGKILERRGLKKLESTYTLSFIERLNPVTNNVHPSFLQTVAETGRISCTNPNLQNLPKKASDLIRRAIIPPDGYCIISVDYSGQEVVILAASCLDEYLLRAYNPCYKCSKIHDKHHCPKITPSIGTPDYCRRIEVHDLVTSKVFAAQIGDTPIWEIKAKFPKLRNIAKAVTFLLVYGGSEPTLAQRTGITLESAKQIFQDYFSAFPGIKPWIREKYSFAIKNGYSEDVLGRRRYYTPLDPTIPINSADSLFSREPFVREDLSIEGLKYGYEHYKTLMSCLRRSQNHPIQGSAAEMTKQGGIYASARMRELPFQAKIIGFIHDEILAICPKNKDNILQTISAIEAGMTKDIPLYTKYRFPECLSMSVGISVGDNWGSTMSVEKYLSSF